MSKIYVDVFRCFGCLEIKTGLEIGRVVECPKSDPPKVELYCKECTKECIHNSTTKGKSK